MFYVFFFYCFLHHLYLHSFPTRRSSDLIVLICDPDLLDDQGCNGSPDLIVEILSPATATHDRWRSEEHTSELQSRGHLVCRLLLEKKKNEKKKSTDITHR